MTGLRAPITEAEYHAQLDMKAADRIRSAVFVFGSNRAGVHGSGAAKFAVRTRGAERGIGEGMTGMSYGIPMKAGPYEKLPFGEVADSVARFINFARTRPDLTFMVSRVGCGRAGFTDNEIMPLFDEAPDNCLLPGVWLARRDPRIVRLIVAGSRTVRNIDWAAEKLDFAVSTLPHAQIEVICGGATGPITPV